MKDPAKIEEFIQDWVAGLAHDNIYSLSLFFYILTLDYYCLHGAASKIIVQNFQSDLFIKRWSTWVFGKKIWLYELICK